MSMQDDIGRLRWRAAYYRREAARSQQRARLVYCRALASHLEREATELELVVKSKSSHASLASDIRQEPVELSLSTDEQGAVPMIGGLGDE